MRIYWGRSLILASVACLLSTVSASAEQWKIVGPRALGMGGAHVAVVNDSSAQYWNPATFGFFGRQAGDDAKRDEHSDRDFGIYFHGGVGYQTHEDILKEVDDVQLYDIDTLQTEISVGGLTQANVDDYVLLIADLDDLNKAGVGATALVDGGLHVRYRNWALGGFLSIDLSAIPTIDLVNINPGTGGVDLVTEMANLPGNAEGTPDVLSGAQMADLIDRIDDLSGWSTAQATSYVQAFDEGLKASPVPVATDQKIEDTYNTAVIVNASSGGNSFDQNTSKILFRGAYIKEVPLTYGHALSDNLSIGVNIKAMKARTYYSTVDLYDENEADTDDFFGDAGDDYLESSDIGLDLGVLYKVGNLRVGAVGRNLNKPSFDFKGPGDYELDPQVRAGVALRVFDFITLAADVDVTENDTNISDNYKSKNLGAGAEFDLFRFLRLRMGAYKNLSESDIGPVYTAGLGLNFFAFQLDLGGSISSDTTTVDGDDIPEEIRGEMARSFQF